MGPSESGSGTGRPASGGAVAVVGLQWGDEGKGKLVDRLAPSHDAVVRYNGGANAGHTVVVAGTKYALHLVPSGILHPGVLAVVGNGVVVDVERLLEEREALAARGVDVSGLVVSDRAHVVMPYHKAEDALREQILGARAASGAGGNAAPRRAVSAIGTTGRGIGPAYADKVQRASAIRVGDLLHPDILRSKLELICGRKNAMFEHLSGSVEGETPRFDPDELGERYTALGERLRAMVRDTTYLLHELLDGGGRVLFEGANATMLDVDHGTYPYVTSSNASALGIGPGTGVPASRLGRTIGVVKAYSTRVGGGPMPTEQDNELGQRLRQRGNEFGTTTGRPRRCGWLDLVAVRYAAMVCGADELCLTLFDVLSGFETLPVCVGYRDASGVVSERFCADGFALEAVEPVYQELVGFAEDVSGVRRFEDLPEAARAYVGFVEDFVGVPVAFVSVGPDREQTIDRRADAVGAL